MAFPDALQSRGLYQYKAELPFVPGAEIAGVVRSAPADSGFAKGDRVAGLTMLNGGMAEVVALQPERVFKLPDNVSFEAGAGLLFNDLTMHHALRTRGRLADGETVLVHGAAGGIGTSTLRLAPAWGAARTIAVVGTEDKIAIAKSAGRIRRGIGRRIQGRRHGADRRPGRGHRRRPGRRRPVHRLAALPGAGRPAARDRVHRRRDPHRQGEPPAAQQRRRGRRRLGRVDVHPSRLSSRAVGRAGTAAGFGPVSAPQPEIYPLERAGEAIASLENRTAKGKVVVKTPVRLLRRRRSVPVETFDAATGQWTDVDAANAVDRDELTLSTFNIWNDSKHAEQRYLAIAELLSRRTPDVMVFQEVTPAALDVFLAQPWIRDGVFARGGRRRRCRAITEC